jgi:DNA-binding MarR family transcriptional regulator
LRKGTAAVARLQTELPGWNIDQLDYPTFRVTLLGKIMDRLTVRYLAEQGDLVYAEWRVLCRLATAENGATVKQVADLAWVDRAEVSRAASSLEARGYTSRSQNPRDRRTPVLHVTKAGMKLYRREVKRRRAFHEALVASLSDEERILLDGLLARIGENLLNLVTTQAGD